MRRTGRWIEDWRPEDPEFWEATGRPVARRNLVWSIFAEHLGFSVWLVWSVSSAFLLAQGFSFTPQQLFLLVALPNLVGSLLRLPYTFAVPRFGGRNWTIVSAALLLVPTLLFAVAVQHPGTPYWVFCLIAATAGFGGGNFASSMANINFFYPAAQKGAALGLNAAGGNLGVALIQLLLPVLVGGAGIFGLVKAAEGGIHLERAAYVYAGLAVVGHARGVPLHGQPRDGHVEAARAAARAAAAPHLGDVVPLHRHVRVVHRLLRGDAAADQAELLGAGAGAPGHRDLLRLLRVPRRRHRLSDPAARRLAGRPVRRRAGHAGGVRGDDRLHAGRAGDGPQLTPNPAADPAIATATSRCSPGSWASSSASSPPPASATARRTG